MLLNQSISIRGMELKNRLVFPPMGSHTANDDGSVSEKTIAHYQRIMESGQIGLVILEHCYINTMGKAYENQLSVASDDMIEGLSKLANVIHENGAKAVLQLNHAGSLTEEAVVGGQPISASAIAAPKSKECPREITVEEIQQTVKDYADAALRVKKAGFDGVEIHAAHSYLLNQFYSPLTNQRKDEYGGNLSGRLKMIVEVIGSVRQQVGDFPILLRFGACDYMDGGTTIEESIHAAKMLEVAGVDLFDVTGGLCQFIVRDLLGRPAYFAELSGQLKRHIAAPIIVAGGIIDPQIPEQLLQEGAADLIGVCRAINKDPDWVNNVFRSLNGSNTLV